MIGEGAGTTIWPNAIIDEREINQVGAHHTIVPKVVHVPPHERDTVVLPHGDGVTRAPRSVGRSQQLVCSLHYLLCGIRSSTHLCCSFRPLCQGVIFTFEDSIDGNDEFSMNLLLRHRPESLFTPPRRRLILRTSR